MEMGNITYTGLYVDPSVIIARLTLWKQVKLRQSSTKGAKHSSVWIYSPSRNYILVSDHVYIQSPIEGAKHNLLNNLLILSPTLDKLEIR